MNLPTPTNTPTKHTQTALLTFEASPVAFARNENTVQQTTQDLAKQLASKASAHVIAQLPAAPSVTSIAPVSKLNEPRRLNNNDVQTFKRGQLIYRADDFYNDHQRDHYKAKFFALNIGAATNNYGKVQLQFELLQDVNLLRLDREADGFKNWLDGNKKIDKADKEILHKNFGYPTPEAPNTERKRNSVGAKDRTMLVIIQKYAEETKQEIHGYCNDIMVKEDDIDSESGPSKFHAEFAVFDKNVVSKPERIDNFTENEVMAINAQAKSSADSRKLGQKKKRDSLEISLSGHERSQVEPSQRARNVKPNKLSF